MNEALLVQGSPEWRQARCGSLGASRIADVVAKTKTGWGASRANLASELIVERLTGIPADGYCSKEMLWGIEHEPEGRAAYEFHTNADVVQVGLIRHPRIEGTHASPDGLVGDAGLLEIKCPGSATHIDTLLGTPFPSKYRLQAMWQMACTGRKWCDLVSYDPRMPEAMRLHVERVAFNAAEVDILSDAVELFLKEVAAKQSTLISQFAREKAA